MNERKRTIIKHSEKRVLTASQTMRRKAECTEGKADRR
jgi:hypothetical protein